MSIAKGLGGIIVTQKNLKENYKRLRVNGFTAKEANLLKHRSVYKIGWYIEMAQRWQVYKEKILTNNFKRGDLDHEL